MANQAGHPIDQAAQKEIGAHLRKAGERFEVARDLHRQGKYEDAVSRAYYSIYHAAQAALLTEGLRPKTHRGLAALFGFHLVQGGKLPKKLAKYLRNIRDDREESDYEIYSNVDRETSETALREAEEFVQVIKEFLATHLKIKISDLA